MTVKSHHSRVFEELLAAHRADLVNAIVDGVPGDYAAYKRMVGELQGLNIALNISREADLKLSGEL